MPETQLKRLILTRLLGSAAGLIQGDFLTRDRWLWLKPRLPETTEQKKLLDVGCGTGAFTICAAQRGYAAVGLTWDEADTKIATERARICGVANAIFRICDVRRLDEQGDLAQAFDVVICCENIEHIIDDQRLVMAMEKCLKPGGRLCLTTPNYHYKPISKDDDGPFLLIEDGRHVRRGYTEESLRKLFEDAGLVVERISYCSGFASQKLSGFLRHCQGKARLAGWLLTLPLRYLVPPFDRVFHALVKYPLFSICIEAHKKVDGR